MPLVAGTVLGRYRLTTRAGAGGMAEVWQAEDGTLGRVVAVKVIFENVSETAEYRDRFLREARMVAGLEHPFILPVYDFGTATIDGKDISYLVMPLVSGGTLKQAIRGPVAWPQALTWLSAIGQALDFAASRGILHRDVKPGNVLMDAAGRPLLADFGLARAQESHSGLTATGTVLGTPSYMAPEQAMGQKLDARADQYALGVIAFEMLTGRVPFAADSPLAVLHQHVAVPPPPVSSVVDGFPAAADAALARALAKTPPERFETCSAFVAALAHALGVSIATSAASMPAVAARPADDAPTVRTGPPEAAVLSGSGRPPGMTSPASLPPPPPAIPARAPRSPVVPVAIVVVAAAAGGVSLFLLRKPAAVEEPRAAARLESGALRAAAPTVPAPASVAPPPEQPPATSNPATATGPAPDTATAPVRTEAPAPSTASAVEPPARAPRERLASREPRRERERAAGGPSTHLPAREALFPRGGGTEDAGLAAGFRALDPSARSGGRLERADFAEALGAARASLGQGDTRQAEFLDSFARAGLAFADGEDQKALVLLRQAFQKWPGAGGRRLRFVRQTLSSFGARPGRDVQWILGVAFADVRGDLADEIRIALDKNPTGGAVNGAAAILAWDRGNAADAAAHARAACDAGYEEVCALAR